LPHHRLINEMLDYVNHAAATPTPTATGCNLRQLIREKTNQISPLAQAKNITLDVFAVDSTPGQGSSFTFSLPLPQQQQAA
jgi:signal transduction histidine kinase